MTQSIVTIKPMTPKDFGGSCSACHEDAKWSMKVGTTRHVSHVRFCDGCKEVLRTELAKEWKRS